MSKKAAAGRGKADEGAALASLFQDPTEDTNGFADQFHTAFQSRTWCCVHEAVLLMLCSPAGWYRARGIQRTRRCSHSLLVLVSRSSTSPSRTGTLCIVRAASVAVVSLAFCFCASPRTLAHAAPFILSLSCDSRAGSNALSLAACAAPLLTFAVWPTRVRCDCQGDRRPEGAAAAGVAGDADG